MQEPSIRQVVWISSPILPYNEFFLKVQRSHVRLVTFSITEPIVNKSSRAHVQESRKSAGYIARIEDIGFRLITTAATPMSVGFAVR
jgi:hypothetical protein